MEPLLRIEKDFRGCVRLMLLVIGVNLSGCVSYPQQLELPIHSQSLLKRDFYTVDIPSFDGETIRATIYQPALAPHESAPLIIHAHGFGMFRMSGPNSLYAQFIFSGIAAKKAWTQGYWVMSFDHRGHGGSGGHIHLMDPDTEVRDLSWVLDWVEQNLPRVKYRDRNLVVGMIGESYGGGLQLLAASLDDRVDAIVPVTTWYDFSSVLTPNDVVKSGWLTALVAMGNVMNPISMNRDLTKAYLNSLVNDVPPQFAPMMMSRSLSNSCYCRADAFPHADAFFIQGFRDVLFPVNEAVKNARCLEAAGRDVRLLGTQNGHLLPMTQFALGLPGYDVDSTVNCDGRRYRTDDLVLAWFDEKLKGQVNSANIVPKVCLTHDRKNGSTYEEIPVGGREFEFHDATIGSGFSGLFELPLTLADMLTSGLTLKTSEVTPVTSDERDHQRANVRPLFVPLHAIEASAVLAGIPQVEFELTGTARDVIFAGVGVKRNGATAVELVSEQVHPFRGGRSYSSDLPAISTILHRGDVIGLVFSGYSNQYRLTSRFMSHATVSGKIALPLQE